MTGLVDIVPHPNQSRYPNQRVLVVACGDYAHLVSFFAGIDRRPAERRPLLHVLDDLN